MTDRMEPTTRLRWVERDVDSGDWVVNPMIRVRVLQQLWVAPLTHPDVPSMVIGQSEEWRDVPAEEG